MEFAPRRRIDRAPTSVQLVGLPVVSVMIGSLAVLLPVISAAPLLPPFGFMLLLAWRLLQRTMWPVWMALPLGLFDDIFSGQPLGSAVFLWTLTFLTLDLIDRRMIWRDSLQDWALASLLIVALLTGELIIANATGGNTGIIALVPQIVVSCLLYPLIARICANLDRIRQSA